MFLHQCANWQLAVGRLVTLFVKMLVVLWSSTAEAGFDALVFEEVPEKWTAVVTQNDRERFLDARGGRTEIPGMSLEVCETTTLADGEVEFRSARRQPLENDRPIAVLRVEDCANGREGATRCRGKRT